MAGPLVASDQLFMDLLDEHKQPDYQEGDEYQERYQEPSGHEREVGEAHRASVKQVGQYR